MSVVRSAVCRTFLFNLMNNLSMMFRLYVISQSLFVAHVLSVLYITAEKVSVLNANVNLSAVVTNLTQIQNHILCGIYKHYDFLDSGMTGSQRRERLKDEVYKYTLW